MAVLQQPDFVGNMAGVMRAAQRLDGVLGVRLDAGLDELACGTAAARDVLDS